MRVWAMNGTNACRVPCEVATAQLELLLREHDDRAPFRRFVGQRRQLRGVGQFLLVDAGRRMERRRLAVAERDRAGLVEQQHVDVAGRLDGAAEVAITLARTMRSMPAMPIADSRPPIVVGIRQTSSATSTVIVTALPCPACATAYTRERRSVTVASRNTSVSMREQDRQARSRSASSALRAFDHRDHPVEERLAGIGGHADDEPVREHARAAGDGREVAAGFAHHRRAFAGDRALVDRRDALDDLAVGRRSISPASTRTMSPLRRRARRARSSSAALHAAARPSFVAPDVAARRAQRGGLRLAAPFGERLGEVREQHREPEPGGDREDEPPAPRRYRRQRPGRSRGAWSARCRRTRRTSPGCGSAARIELPEGRRRSRRA